MSIEYVYPTGCQRFGVTPTSTASCPAGSPEFFGGDGFSFGDILDAVNPLQQLPGISTAYRAITGDTISTASRLVGGALFGGPVGFVMALANEIFESGTGKDIGEAMLAMVIDDKETQVAQNIEAGPSPANRAAYEAYERMQSLMA